MFSPRPWHVKYGETREVLDAGDCPVAKFLLAQDADAAVHAVNTLNDVVREKARALILLTYTAANKEPFLIEDHEDSVAIDEAIWALDQALRTSHP